MSKKAIDISGNRYGKLLVVCRAQKTDSAGSAHWICRCDCGNMTVVARPNLIRGKTSSCGCSRALTTYRHGGWHTRLYRTWANMKARCLNPNKPNYKNYGGRGIAVCAEWANDFVRFRDWALAAGYRDDLTIERIDVNGNYEPSNCAWIPLTEQARNKRTRNATVVGI